MYKISNCLHCIFFVALLFSIGCQKESKETDFAVISTNEVKIDGSTKAGVVFSASILLENDEAILEQGFTYALHDNPDLQDFVLNVDNINRSHFKVELEDALRPDTTYYVRSFVKTEKYFIYGNEVNFFSNGSEPPLIDKVDPPLAFWGDTIMITGNNFDHSGKNNTVWFNEFEATETWGNMDTIYAIVPNELNAKKSQIKVNLYDKQSDNSKTFEIHSPIIQSISHTEGQHPDTVTIFGDFFSNIHG
ncbi:MAG: IPT/TIG domain-containing protein, partial [Bacteroidales bacterium]|nr:IPT/TIG domain-containing protein [Bacteroidales bacterium]